MSPASLNLTSRLSQIINELKETIAACKVTTKIPGDSPLAIDDSLSPRNACVLTAKAIDKILIRYNCVPSKFTEPFDEHYTSFIANYELANSLEINSFGMQSHFAPIKMPGDRKYDASVDEHYSYREMQMRAKVNLAAQAVHVATDTFAILSRYFHHQRWIWFSSNSLAPTKVTDMSSDVRDTLMHTHLLPLVTALTQ